jgi:hypothetical protein
MYKAILWVHIAGSLIWSATALYLVARTISGIVLKKPFPKFLKHVSLFYIIVLYIQLILGFILYFYLKPNDQTIMTIEYAKRLSALKFWSLEHLTVMTFALILSQIGYIFLMQKIPSKSKYTHSLFYFGISTLITIVSMVLYMIYKP